MIYNCEICKYKTMYESNLIRHKQTKKHKKKCDTYNKFNTYDCKNCKKSFKRKYNRDRHIKICKIENEQIDNENGEKSDNNTITIEKIQKGSTKTLLNTLKHRENMTIIDLHNKIEKLICVYCRTSFTRSWTLNRHLKVCEMKKSIENDKNNEKDLIIYNLRKELKMSRKEIANANNSKKFYETLIIESGFMVKQSFSALTNISTDYKNAPHLRTLEVGMINDIEKDKFKLGLEIAYHYKNKTLGEFLGKIIVGIYKKNDPSMQSLWSTDISRFTYLIKELFEDKTSGWIMDKKGIKTIKKIIFPLLEHIKKIVISSQEMIRDKLCKGLSPTETDYYLDIGKQQSLVIKDIKEGLLENDILKYISPHLSYNSKQLDK